MNPTSKVFNVDCLAYMRTVEDKFFDLAIVDPPYQLKKSSVRGSGKLKTRTLNTSDMRWDVAPTKEYFDELFRVSKNQIIWGGNYFDLPPCRCFVAWDKMQPWQNFSQVEFAWTSFDKPAKLFRYSNRRWKKWHPTGKPIELYDYLLKTFAKVGDVVFDSHLGGGTSRIAAYKAGFDFYGCEINKDFYNLAQEHFNIECQTLSFTSDGIQTQQLELFGDDRTG